MGAFSSLTPPGGCTIYPGPYNTIALLTNLRPNDRQPGVIAQNNEAYVPLQFDWTNLISQISVALPYTLGYLVNVGLAPNAIDKIACVVIDNSYCDYDIHLQFIDGFTLTIPAWTPIAVYPVITNARAFTIWADGPAQIFAPVGGVITAARHGTTNVFVCNANIPPIVVPNLIKQVYNEFAISAAGTYNVYTGVTAPGGGLATQGTLQQIIVNNATQYTTNQFLAVVIIIDNVNFAEVVWFSPDIHANPATNPLIISNLNIRTSLVSYTIGTGGAPNVNMQLTTVYLDHSGSAILT